MCLKVNLSIEEGEKLGNKHVQGYGELFLTRGKDALAALATDLKESIVISVHDSIKICIKRVLPSKALKTNSENLPEILYIYFFSLRSLFGCPTFFFSPKVLRSMFRLHHEVEGLPIICHHPLARHNSPV